MAADGCQCTALEDNRILRQQRWRELCAKFYYDKDETAKRVLDFFEASKVDEISISAVEETGADEQFNEAVQTLGLHKCMVSGHEKNFTKIIEMLEVVKTEVRAGYHEHVSKTRYAEFEIQAKKSQGTNYELTTDKNNRHRVSVRVQHNYMRMTKERTTMVERVGVFIEKHLANAGCHPFLAGLYAVLQWNLESTTIVAWKLSDSVFVESGNSEFTHNALVLLVLALNFSHSESAESCTLDATITKGVKTRNWYLDPYMSDFDIRQIMRQFPPAKRLEGRPTGTKMHTRLDRLNVHGQLDESHNFFDRWCIIL